MKNGFIIDFFGTKRWYKNNKLHRSNRPAVITKHTKEWYQNGKLHRLKKPAFVGQSIKMWYQNGKLHRLDRPAVEFSYGAIEWWINDLPYDSFLDYVEQLVKRKLISKKKLGILLMMYQ